MSEVMINASPIEKTEICAGIPDPDGGLTLKHAFPGDFGGLLTCIRERTEGPELTGILSRGVHLETNEAWDAEMAGFPDIYTNIWHFLDWINGNIRETGHSTMQATALSTSTLPLLTTEDAYPTMPVLSTKDPFPTMPVIHSPVTPATTTTPAATSTTKLTNAATCEVDGPFTEIKEKIPTDIATNIGQCNKEWSQSQRIVGGTIIEANSYPWQALIVMPASYCGGSIISDQWVVTAAHCCKGQSSFRVFIGKYDRLGTDKGEFSVLSEEIIMHPDYNSRNMENDICLVKVPSLAKNSKTSGCVKNGRSCYAPICLPSRVQKMI